MSRIVVGALILGGLGFVAKTFSASRADDAPFLLNLARQILAVLIARPSASWSAYVGSAPGPSSALALLSSIR